MTTRRSRTPVQSGDELISGCESIAVRSLLPKTLEVPAGAVHRGGWVRLAVAVFS